MKSIFKKKTLEFLIKLISKNAKKGKFYLVTELALLSGPIDQVSFI